MCWAKGCSLKRETGKWGGGKHAKLERGRELHTEERGYSNSKEA